MTGPEVAAAMKAEDVECPLSQRVDGKKHSWKWASDGPYIACHYCGELQDAMNGTVITPGRKS